MMRKTMKLAIRGLKTVVEAITLIAPLCCLSGIDEQPWQVIPAVMFFALWIVLMVVWEEAECLIEWLE